MIAVTAPDLFPNRSGPNEFAQLEQPRPTLTTRLTGLLDETVGTISLPGSIGTLTELMVAWNRSFLEELRAAPAPPVIAVGERWAAIVTHLAAIVGSGHLVTTVTTVDDAVAALVDATRA